MTIKLIQQFILTYKKDTSDKIYKVSLREVEPKLYTVDAEYGKRGSNLKSTTKTPKPVSLAEAETIFYRLINEKLKKGYIKAAGQFPNSKTKENRQAIVDHIKKEKGDDFLNAAMEAGLNPIGDFEGLDLSNIDFTTEEIYNADEYYDLTHANLENTNLSLCILRYINLNHANLKKANLSGAELTALAEANLTEAKLTDAHFGDVSLSGANCQKADFSRATFGEEYSSFADGNFQYAKFVETRFASENDIDGCDFSHADFSHAQGIFDLFGIRDIQKGVNFSYANFSYVDFRGFDFSRLKLDLKYVKFCHTNLRGANFSNVDLSYSNFANANLENANFENCNLTGASLNKANLKGANLKGVNFHNLLNCQDIQIDLKTTIDPEWQMLVNEKAANKNYNFEKILEQLKTLKQPSWELIYINNPDGTEFPVNEVHGHIENLAQKIHNGHTLQLLIRFVGEDYTLSLSPQAVSVEGTPHPKLSTKQVFLED